LGEFDRIAAQIVENLPETQGVSQDFVRQFSGQVENELQAPFPGGKGKWLGNRLQSGLEMKGDIFQMELACFDFRNIQNIVDDFEQGIR